MVEWTGALVDASPREPLAPRMPESRLPAVQTCRSASPGAVSRRWITLRGSFFQRCGAREPGEGEKADGGGARTDQLTEVDTPGRSAAGERNGAVRVQDGDHVDDGQLAAVNGA
ncbi:hypothetical protein [Streptomyces sp. NPDC088752]|uniref:hypothetical protein n=1 Tax=Streptomyces sp. NPDC088752 TaxID=3154963 RepID=UPI003433E9E3